MKVAFLPWARCGGNEGKDGIQHFEKGRLINEDSHNQNKLIVHIQSWMQRGFPFEDVSRKLLSP